MNSGSCARPGLWPDRSSPCSAEMDTALTTASHSSSKGAPASGEVRTTATDATAVPDGWRRTAVALWPSRTTTLRDSSRCRQGAKMVADALPFSHRTSKSDFTEEELKGMPPHRLAVQRQGLEPMPTFCLYTHARAQSYTGSRNTRA
jgi:hypothetical protein